MNINLKEIKETKSIQELLEFGIINVDKSSGPTSFNISAFVRRNLNLRKTSHFGTLDPKVTGVLPIALNRACKLTGYFLGENKTYVGIMRLHEEISLDEIQKEIQKKFLGKINQIPPLKSRVKRQERQREIIKFDLLEKNGKDFLFSVECQGGTYIRKLIDDLGKELNIGAHMLELRRTKAGIFSENDSEYPAIKLYDLEKAIEEYKQGNEKLLREMIIPGEIITELYPTIKIKSTSEKNILTGKPIKYDDLIEEQNFKNGEKVTVFCKKRFIGIYKIINNESIFAKGEFVMQPIRG